MFSCFLSLSHSSSEEIRRKPGSLPFFFESFDDPDWKSRWVISSKSEGQFETRELDPKSGLQKETMLFGNSPSSASYAISTRFPYTLNATNQEFVIQYELRNENEWECSRGTTLKLFSDILFNFVPENYGPRQSYAFVFGYNQCNGRAKTRFNWGNMNLYKNDSWGRYWLELKRMARSKRISEFQEAKLNHLYTLVIRPDATWSMLIDGRELSTGSLVSDTDFVPPVNPPRMIDDPADPTPADWDERPEIPDPEEVARMEGVHEYIPDPEKVAMPETWHPDEPLYIPDPQAVRPEEWDDDLFGEWEVPLIPNPICEPSKQMGCGPYEPPLIRNPDYIPIYSMKKVPNPAYKGLYTHRQIPNPDYHNEKYPQLLTFNGIGFEGTIEPGIGIKNIYIGTSIAAMQEWNLDHFYPKSAIERRAHGLSVNYPTRPKPAQNQNSKQNSNENSNQNSGQNFGQQNQFVFNWGYDKQAHFIPMMKGVLQALWAQNPIELCILILLAIFLPLIFIAEWRKGTAKMALVLANSAKRENTQVKQNGKGKKNQKAD